MKEPRTKIMRRELTVFLIPLKVEQRDGKLFVIPNERPRDNATVKETTSVDPKTVKTEGLGHAL
jgi:hypothetical protein